MVNEDKFQALAKLALQNKKLIDVSFEIINDVINMIVPKFERCSASGCKEPATVKHVDLNVCVCDKHAATAIVRAHENIRNCTSADEIDLLRIHLANEELWADMPNATCVRRLKDYIDIINKNNDSDPVSRSELH